MKKNKQTNKTNKKSADHVHLRQNLGNPGYECPQCPQNPQLLLAPPPPPKYYPPTAEQMSSDHIAGLQWQLDALRHNMAITGHLPESRLRDGAWGRVVAGEAPRWPQSQADVRLRLERVTAILQGWTMVRREEIALPPQRRGRDPVVTNHREEEVVPPGSMMTWAQNNFTNREAQRQRAQSIRRTQIRQEQKALHAMRIRASYGQAAALPFAPPPVHSQPWTGQSNIQPPSQVLRLPPNRLTRLPPSQVHGLLPSQGNQAPPNPVYQVPAVDARTDPGFRRYLEILEEMGAMALAEGPRRWRWREKGAVVEWGRNGRRNLENSRMVASWISDRKRKWSGMKEMVQLVVPFVDILEKPKKND